MRCDDGIHIVFAYTRSGTVKVNDSVNAVPTFWSFSVGFCFCFGFFAHFTVFYRLLWVLVLMLILIWFLCTSLKHGVSEKRTEETRYHHKIGWFFAFMHICQCGLMFTRSRARSRHTLQNSHICKNINFMYTNGSKWWNSKRWICDKKKHAKHGPMNQWM